MESIQFSYQEAEDFIENRRSLGFDYTIYEAGVLYTGFINNPYLLYLTPDEYALISKSNLFVVIGERNSLICTVSGIRYFSGLAYSDASKIIDSMDIDQSEKVEWMVLGHPTGAYYNILKFIESEIVLVTKGQA